MQRKSLSIRDIINLVQFIKVNSRPNLMLTH
jgi:midasin